MDINDLRSILILAGLLIFVGICVWAWRRKRREAFDEAALLPFADEAPPHDTNSQARGQP
ncbi:MAG TPA: cbb3-type cytochrome c oxidase subunit 3 [Rubrivivax sp.]